MIWLQIGTTVLVGLIGWLISSKFNQYDKDHENHYAHANDLSLHDIDRERDAKKVQLMEINNSLIRHVDQDNRTFEKLENKIDDVSTDVKNILQSVARLEASNGRHRQS